MRELIYATTNMAKLNAMRKILSALPITLIGLNELDVTLPVISESGTDPLTNAVLKAAGYYQVIGRPLFSADSGLYIEGLPDGEQPGVHVREVKGRRLTDDEMIKYYAGIARRLGGRVTARYINGICLVLSDTERFTRTGPEISYEPFYLADKPHIHRRDGFPLDSLSIRIDSGRYYYDVNYSDTRQGDELALKSAEGFKRFFQEALKL